MGVGNGMIILLIVLIIWFYRCWPQDNQLEARKIYRKEKTFLSQQETLTWWQNDKMVEPGSSKSAADLIKVFVPIMHFNCYASFGKLFSFCIIGGHYKDTDLMHGYQDYNNDADNVPLYIYGGYRYESSWNARAYHGHEAQTRCITTGHQITWMTSGPKIQMRGLWSKLERALSPGVAAGQALAYLTCLTKVSLETFRLSTLVLQMHGRVGQDWHILLKSDKAVKWASFAVGITN